MQGSEAKLKAEVLSRRVAERLLDMLTSARKASLVSRTANLGKNFFHQQVDRGSIDLVYLFQVLLILDVDPAEFLVNCLESKDDDIELLQLAEELEAEAEPLPLELQEALDDGLKGD